MGGRGGSCTRLTRCAGRHAGTQPQRPASMRRQLQQPRVWPLSGALLDGTAVGQYPVPSAGCSNNSAAASDRLAPPPAPSPTRVCDDVVVREHRPLGHACGAARVIDQRNVRGLRQAGQAEGLSGRCGRQGDTRSQGCAAPSCTSIGGAAANHKVDQNGGPARQRQACRRARHLGRLVRLGVLVAQRSHAVQRHDLAVRRRGHLWQPLVRPCAKHHLGRGCRGVGRASGMGSMQDERVTRQPQRRTGWHGGAWGALTPPVPCSGYQQAALGKPARPRPPRSPRMGVASPAGAQMGTPPAPRASCPAPRRCMPQPPAQRGCRCT